MNTESETAITDNRYSITPIMPPSGVAAPPVRRIVHVLKDAYTVYIGRRNRWHRLPQSKWANPEPLPPNATVAERAANLDRYERHVRSREDLMTALEAGELEDAVVACWCKSADPAEDDDPERACHGDVLVRLQAEVTGKRKA